MLKCFCMECRKHWWYAEPHLFFKQTYVCICCYLFLFYLFILSSCIIAYLKFLNTGNYIHHLFPQHWFHQYNDCVTLNSLLLSFTYNFQLLPFGHFSIAVKKAFQQPSLLIGFLIWNICRQVMVNMTWLCCCANGINAECTVMLSEPHEP